MPSFHHGEVEIAYLDEGAGEPIVLVHGFASNKEVNWVNPGWVTTLTGAGRRAIALDNRGHGASSKLYDPAAYHSATMAEDVRALLDHLGIERADVMGYSMGARIAAFLAVNHPARVRSRRPRRARHPPGGGRRLAGRTSPRRWRRRRSPTSATRPAACSARFAEQTKSDLQGARRLHPRHRARPCAASRSPVSACRCWSRSGPKTKWPALRKNWPRSFRARARSIFPNRDHMLAVGDKVFKAGVLDFLNQRA